MTNADNSTSAKRLTAQEACALIAPMSREEKLTLLGYLRQLRAQPDAERPAGGAA